MNYRVEDPGRCPIRQAEHVDLSPVAASVAVCAANPVTVLRAINASESLRLESTLVAVFVVNASEALRVTNMETAVCTAKGLVLLEHWEDQARQAHCSGSQTAWMLQMQALMRICSSQLPASTTMA